MRRWSTRRPTDCRRRGESLSLCLLSSFTCRFSGILTRSWLRSWTVWDCEEKRCALVYFCFRPDPAAVLVDNTLAGRKPHPGAFEILRAVKTLEDPEEFAGILHVKTSAVIANKYDLLVINGRLSHLNYSAHSDPCVLDGIGQDIDEHLLDQARIAL